jgi:SET domain-containing protein
MYKPLPSYLTIKPSEIEGLGLFATDDIDNKHFLGITHVYDVRFQDSFIRTPLGGFFNHSETPNCEVIRDGEYLKLKAIRNIKAGEEITARYTLYDPTKL